MKPDPLKDLAALNDTLAQRIAITQALGIKAERYDGNRLTLSAPAAANLNDKNTVFAGSLYSTAVLCGWSLLFLKLREAGLNADIAVYQADINYLKPATGDFRAVCAAPEPAVLADFLEALDANGKARLTLAAEVHDPRRQVASFTGKYAVLVNTRGTRGKFGNS